MRNSSRQNAAFTLAEMMIAIAGSVIVIGALMASSIALQKSFHASETYANSQADQRRLIDYIARDLRRSIGISVMGTGGVASRLTAGSMNFEANSTLIVTLPAYYKSNTPADNNYDQALSIVAAGDRVAYGTSAGPSPAFPVSYRKLFIPSEKSTCYVREEGNVQQIIVRDAEELQVQLTVESDGESCSLAAQFLSPYSREKPIVAVHDEVMLRNARID